MLMHVLKPSIRFFLVTPINPIRPEPKSHAAAGRGTGGISVVFTKKCPVHGELPVTRRLRSAVLSNVPFPSEIRAFSIAERCPSMLILAALFSSSGAGMRKDGNSYSMPRVLSPGQWRCGLIGSHDGCVVWFLSAAPKLVAHEGMWPLFGYDLHQEAFLYIGGD
jgi:hypothetical protein